MPDSFETALNKSTITFKKLIEPEIKDIFKCEFDPVEGVTNKETANRLDMLAGIDLWLWNKNHGMRGIGNRVQEIKAQFGEKYFPTFTIRKTRDSGSVTEFEKRVKAIENEWLYPHLTIQSYVNHNRSKLLGFAASKTKDIISMIKKGLFTINHTGRDQYGQASFYVVWWDDLLVNGYDILIKDYTNKLNLKANKKIKTGEINVRQSL